MPMKAPITEELKEIIENCRRSSWLSDESQKDSWVMHMQRAFALIEDAYEAGYEAGRKYGYEEMRVLRAITAPTKVAGARRR
jgi:hypothetical protein